jgi:hypothetical protein
MLIDLFSSIFIFLFKVQIINPPVVLAQLDLGRRYAQIWAVAAPRSGSSASWGTAPLAEPNLGSGQAKSGRSLRPDLSGHWPVGGLPRWL